MGRERRSRVYLSLSLSCRPFPPYPFHPLSSNLARALPPELCHWPDDRAADFAAVSDNDPSTIVQNFLNSLKGGHGPGSQQQDASTQPFTTLPDLLPPATTIPVIDASDSSWVDSLLSNLPPTLPLMAQEVDDLLSINPTSEAAQAAIEALSLEQKKDILRRVLRSPQFSQSLGSLTVALRDGGLPSVSEALHIKVDNGGFLRGGGVPLGGGQAVEAFLAGVRRTVEEEDRSKST